MSVALAVDGGNSKTDLALVRDDGGVLALVRGGMSSPHHIGLEGSVELLRRLYADAVEQAGLAAPVDVAHVLLAGLDFPTEERGPHQAPAARGGARGRTAATRASRRSGRSAGTGAAATTWGWRRSAPRLAARTGAARRRGSSARCRRISGSACRARSP